MKTVYDLDGTLVDTREAVRQAYAVAGVTMPDDAWGKPAQDWLPQLVGERVHLVHSLKHEAYPEALRTYAHRFPLLDELEFHWQRVTVITGASRQAVNALYEAGLLPRIVRVEAAHLTKQQKVDWLAKHGWGLYIDDDASVRALVLDQTMWSVDTPETMLETLKQR